VLVLIWLELAKAGLAISKAAALTTPGLFFRAFQRMFVIVFILTPDWINLLIGSIELLAILMLQSLSFEAYVF
jgi:hypothetical protein